VRPLIAGTRDSAEALVSRLASQGIEADASAPEDSGAQTEGVAALAASLLALESRMTAEPPTMVLLADRGDHALAAALVASKLLISVSRVADGGAGGEPGENDPLLAQLSEAVRIEALPTLLRS
jgi:hypothetical protein